MEESTLEKLLKNVPKSDWLPIQRAYEFALAAHKNQKRASGEPYIIHPLAVAYFLSTLNLDREAISAALLHDVLEDTDISLKELEENFGKEIAFLVDSVTKLGVISYREAADIALRQNLKAQTLRKMFFAMAKDLRVILIKLADRYHNVQTLKYLSPQHAHQIALETIEIYAPIAERLGMGNIKGNLEDLSFPYAYPKEYKWLNKQIKEPREDKIRYLNALIPKIKKIIESKNIEIRDIHWRAKHYYSLYKKLLIKDMDSNQVYDLIAVRIILPTVESCYEVLGIIHTYYKPLIGLIKDYIALPKPSGYQSIHTTVFCDKGKIVEIQLRTPKMHKYAENGIAAHWVYTESGKTKNSTVLLQEVSWVSKLREVLKETSPGNLIKNLKLDFFKHRIYIFTPKGDVIDLPEGATPIDAAYEIHTQLGHMTAGAKVNSKMVSLLYELKNGDVVEIIKSKKEKPSRDWLNIVKTTLAKKKIKAWLARPSFAKQNLGGLARPSFAKQNLGGLPLQTKKKEPAYGQIDQIIIGGQGGVSFRIAKCCNPQSTQKIIGYITRHRGISIHHANCLHLNQKEKNKILPAEWPPPASYRGSLLIKIKDRIGILRDIGSVLANLKINIKEIKNTPSKKGEAEIKLILDTKNSTELESAQKEIGLIKDIKSVKRLI